MSEERVRFPEFGEGGDYIGARRGRRAFRFFVTAAVFFTLVLAFSELYLQQGGAERLYTHSLTLPDESSRVLLRQAVLRDRQNREAPTPKYLQALATREEADRVLPTYEEAFKVDATNPSLAIRYGCQLLLAKRVDEAAGKFAVAAERDPLNALPLYLRAAAQPGGLDTRERLSESLAIIAQANSSGKRVIFPRPLWSSVLPQRGRVYAGLSRRIVDECSAPIYHYVQEVVARARKDIEAGRTQYWDSWLRILQQMGERIAGGAVAAGEVRGEPIAGGALQALLGIQVQLAAIDQRQAIIRVGGAPPNNDLNERKAKLEAALAPLAEFENSRYDRIRMDARGYIYPAGLVAATLFGLTLVYSVARTAWNRWGRRIAAVPPEAGVAGPKPQRAETGEEPERTIRHTGLAKSWLVLMGLLLLLTLFGLMALQAGAVPEARWIPAFTVFWTVEIVLLILFGLVYPRLALPSARAVSRRKGVAPEDAEETLRIAARLRRRAAVCLVYRYYGVVIGLTLVVLCAWTLGYRVFMGLYPWQAPLLTTGMAVEETEAVQHALRLLQ